MSRLKRIDPYSHPVFVVANAHSHYPTFNSNYDLLDSALARLFFNYRTRPLAYVWMPNHIHMILPSEGTPIPVLIQAFKLSFARLAINELRLPAGRVWQARYWDHVLRDGHDLNKYMDYVHYNPVHHGHSSNPFNWPHSSIHWDFYKDGYTMDWGRTSIKFDGGFGE